MAADKESIINLLKGLGPYFLTPAMLVFIIWKTSQFTERSQYVQFDTPEDKVKTVEHVKNAPQDVELYKATRRFDSITESMLENNSSAVSSRAKRDSLWQLNAEQIYMIKEELRKQEQVQEKILQTLEVISDNHDIPRNNN